MDTKVKSLIEEAMGNMKQMSDGGIAFGEPLELKNGVTIIPISKVSYGFAGGGTDLPTKTNKELFAGGTGAGMSITPVAFIVITGQDVQLLKMDGDSSNTDLLAMIPDAISKISAIIKKKKEKSSDEEDVVEDMLEEIDTEK